MKLRPYQNDLVSKARSAFASGNKRVLIQLPTGGGKTVILSEICRTAASKNLRVLVMVHRKEILQQIVEKLTIFGLSPSIIDASTKISSSEIKSTYAAMQQTLTRRLDTVNPPDLLITDEAHHQAAKGYMNITEAWPDTKVIGLTATPCRLDGKPLSDCFDELVLGPTTRELIEIGSLCDYQYFAPEYDPELLKGVKKTAGDYNKKQLETVVNKKHIIGSVINHYRKLLNGKPVIAFCVGVDHAEAVAAEFRAAGFRSESVDGGMKADQRADIMDRFRAGEVSVLTSCDLIGEGFDVPDCAGVLLLRPTQSLTIYLQQVGRALRVKADGSKAVILDHVGNCYKHGKPDDPRKWSLYSKVNKNEVSIRQCPQCYQVIDPETGPASCYLSPCHYEDKAPGAREDQIEYVDGELKEYVPAIEVDWCGGIDVRTATGKDWSRVLRAAGRDREKLKEIATARNFKMSWVDMRLIHIQKKTGSYAAH